MFLAMVFPAVVAAPPPPVVATIALALSGAVASASPPPPSYAIIFDCGSSGTRLHIYTVAADGGSLSELPPPKAFKKTPGISTFADDPQAVRAYIRPLLELAAANVPAAQQAETRLVAQATAGMRLLSPAQQEAIWSALSLEFASTAFSFDASDASTISGNYEGLYGWLAASALDSAAVAFGSPFGYLDLGGASTQIAFVPTASAGEPPTILQDAYRVVRGNASARVFAHSFMRSGQDQAQERALWHLYRHAAGSSGSSSDTLLSDRADGGTPPVVTSPCYNPGFHALRTLCPVGEPECTTVNVSGSGNFSACHALTSALLHTEYECLLPPCGPFGSYVPDTAGVPFLASAAYFTTANGLGLIGDDEVMALTADMYAAAGAPFCSRVWAPPLSGTPYAHEYCFMSAYVPSLLASFHLGGSRPITVANVINGTEVSWALGSEMVRLKEQRCQVLEEEAARRAHAPSDEPGGELCTAAARDVAVAGYVSGGGALLAGLVLLGVCLTRRKPLQVLREFRNGNPGGVTLLNAHGVQGAPAAGAEAGIV